MANILLRANNITDVRVVAIEGSLKDNYNPDTKVVSLSEETFISRSISAIGITAHEIGHAIQYKEGYKPNKIREFLIPAAFIGANFGPMFAFWGLALKHDVNNTFGLIASQTFVDIGIILFIASILFYIIDLPVEFNASKRALKLLKETNILNESELKLAKKVLTAAAITYVASALCAVITFIRFFMLINKKG